ncbi:acetyltransferase [SAR86 cluster bacterium]|nr:acetyltransferase [SAR86 cluster bacterium]
MISLRSTFVGIFSLSILVINTLMLALMMIPLGIIKFLIPLKKLRASFTRIIISIGEIWISVNSIWVIKLHNPKLNIVGLENLNGDSWFLSTSNHQSAADIFIVQYLTNRKIPMLKFFIKYELIYVPIIGICWWALDMPFLKRYTQEQIKKNPKLQGRDYKKMKKSLEHYSLHPVSIFSYAEGTRFTLEKHKKQQSEFKNLLKPKEGGLAVALSNINKIKEFIDITIIYDSKNLGFWNYLCGNIKNIKIFISKTQIPEKYLDENLISREELRSDFKLWLNEQWKEKDVLISNNKF